MSEITIYTVEISVAILFNGIVLSMLVMNSSVKKSTSNIFLVNLIVADLVTAVMGLTACLTHYARKKMAVKEWTDSKMVILFMYIFTSSLLVLLMATILVTLDRFVAIVKPYRYREISTRRNVTIILTVIWTLAAIVLILGSVFATMDDRDNLRIAQDALDFVLVVISFAGILFLVIANAIILREVQKQVKHVSSVSVFGNDAEAAKRSEVALRKRELRAVYLCLTIVCVFIVSWLPVSLGLVLNLSPRTKTAGRELMRVGKAVIFVGVILNPCLYVPFKSELRAAFCKCFPCCRAGEKELSSSERRVIEPGSMQSSI